MAAAESVVLETSMGDIQFELYWNHAPKVSIVFEPVLKCSTNPTDM